MGKAGGRWASEVVRREIKHTKKGKGGERERERDQIYAQAHFLTQINIHTYIDIYIHTKRIRNYVMEIDTNRKLSSVSSATTLVQTCIGLGCQVTNQTIN